MSLSINTGTAYSLSLQLDRVPVHAATIEYLTNTFGISPGVEEACLYHSLHLNDPEDILIWLFKCAGESLTLMRISLSVSFFSIIYPSLCLFSHRLACRVCVRTSVILARTHDCSTFIYNRRPIGSPELRLFECCHSDDKSIQ